MDYKTTITIPSTRVYLEEVPSKYWKSILDTFINFNAIKEWTYNRMYDAAFRDVDKFNEAGEIRAEMDRRYGVGVPGYYVTSIYSTVNGMIRSQKELISVYKKENELRIVHIKDNIKKDEKRLKHYLCVKESIVHYSRKLKASSKRLPAVKTYKDTEPELCPVRSNSRYDGKELYEYEIHIDRMIRVFKARINQKKHRVHRLEQKNFAPKRVTFGSRAFYKTKDTKDMSDEELKMWHRKRAFRRMNIIHLSGRHDSPNGNWCCRYNPTGNTITLKCWDGTDVVFENIRFPYRGEELIRNLTITATHTKKDIKSIGYTIEMHRDTKGCVYLLFKASFEVEYDRLNDYTGSGVISVDLNYDNISWSELNSDGCRIDGGVIRFDLLSGCSGHNKDQLGRACAIIASICRTRYKPLVMEDLDTQDAKTKMAYGSKKGNAHASVFAFRTMTNFLKSKCARFGVGVFTVNPAYTSKTAMMKYMRLLNKTIHECASLTIGRRGMGFSERVPKYLRHLVPAYTRKKKKPGYEFSVWGSLTKSVGTVPKRHFYQKHKCNQPLSYYKNLA